MSEHGPRKLRKVRIGVCLVILGCIIVELSSRTGWLDKMEYTYHDLWHKLAGSRSSSHHVVIVAIDDQTLLEKKEEPLAFWGPHFAKAIQMLRQVGVRVIGLDVLFSVSAESWIRKLNPFGSHESRTYDSPLRAQLAEGRVILAATLIFDEKGEGKALLPLPEYVHVLPEGLKDVGLSNFFSDSDGVVRRFVPVFFEVPVLPRITFATLLAVKFSSLDFQSESWSIGGKEIPNRAVPLHISFAGPPNTIARLSFARLLNPDAGRDPEIQSLKDKVVIIAPHHSGMQDIHLTPYARGVWGLQGELMSGAELHANIVETLLSGKNLRSVPFLLRLLYLVLLLSAATTLFLKVSHWRGLGMGVMIGVVCAILGYLMFHIHLLLPVAGAHLGLLLCYLGALGFRFTGEEKRRAHLQVLFGRYVSDEIVEKLLETGRNPDLGGETLTVTVLFSDIRNFTAVSEKLDPHEVVEMLNEYFSRACDPILEQGGTINKFFGDGVMAIFGAPSPSQDHARRALSAAISMKEVADNFRLWMQERFPDKGLPDFQIGIGLHTGKAVIGNIGSPKRSEYTAIGDTVNTASRIEQLTKKYGCLIMASSETVEAGGSGIVSVKRGKTEVKGRQELVEIFEVEGWGET